MAGPELGSAYVRIVPKAPGIESEIGDLIGDGGSDVSAAGGRVGSNLLKGIGSVVSVAAVGKILKDAFEAGGALQQSFGGLETIYGDAAEGAKKYAMEAAAAGISANDYAEQAVSFGAALKQAYGGDTEKAMQAANTAIMDMADNSAKMGTDIGSVQAAYQGFAKQNYTMLDNLKLGYGGTKTEMERLLADAEKLSGVHYDIENLGDVYDAIHVVQTELGLTGVAAGEAQTTLTGSFGALKASWENLLGAMTTGEGLEEAMGNMSTAVGSFLDNVLQMLGTLAPQIPDFIMGLVDTIIANAPALIESGIEIIVQLAVGLIQAIPKIIEKLPEIFEAVKSAFAAIDWAQLGRDLITGLVNGIMALGHMIWDALSGLINNALAWAKNLLGIGSPSKVFRDQIGEMIPAGAAIGIEEGSADVNAAIRDMATGAVGAFSGAGAQPQTGRLGGAMTDAQIERLISAINNRPIVIEGDTSKIFKVVKNANEIRTRATGYNALSMAR